MLGGSYGTRKHMADGGGGISPLIFNLGTWMEMSDRLDAPVALPPGEESRVYIKNEAG